MAEFGVMSTADPLGWTSVRNIVTLARKEARDGLRNRWFVLYALAFAVLALALSALSMVGTGAVGLAGFGRTAASLLNLVMLIVPLMALTAGAAAIAGERERGTLGYLLSQPVSRLEVILGKYLGLVLTMLASLTFGFGLSAVAIAWQRGASDAAGLAQLVVFACVLAVAMLSVGFLISVLARRTSVAVGVAIFVWLAFVFLGDLGLMGSTILFKLQVAELFNLSLINPLQVFKMASLRSITASLDVLGPASLYAIRTYGGWLDVIFASVLLGWIVLPLGAAVALFVRRGDA